MSDFDMMEDLPALASISEKVRAVVCTTVHCFRSWSGIPSLNEAPGGAERFPTCGVFQ